MAINENSNQEEKLEALGKLSASFAHEFNSPLLGIRNILEQVEEELPSNRTLRELVEIGKRECDKLTDLILKFQELDPLATGKYCVSDLNDILEQAILMNADGLQKKNVQLLKEISPGLPSVVVNPTQLKKAFSNIIANSIEASRNHEAKMWVKSEIKNENILIQVQDNGVGIPSKIMAKIFDPFFTTKTAVKGTGLGLTIAFCLLNHHGSTIKVDSNPGVQTTVTVTLPLKRTSS